MSPSRVFDLFTCVEYRAAVNGQVQFGLKRRSEACRSRRRRYRQTFGEGVRLYRRRPPIRGSRWSDRYKSGST